MDIFDLSAIIRLDSSEYEQGLANAEQSASSFGGNLKTAMAVGGAAFAAVGTAVVGTGTAIVKSTGALASYGDNIDKMSQKMGMSAQAYQEWDAVMQHSGTSMETMKASMKTLANAAETGSDAFEKLGISQQELQELSQEQLFERTISALQNVDDETERTYLAGKTLGRGATELGALLNTSAKDTQKMRDRVRELGGVMSDDAVKAAARYQDSLQDMNTAFSGVTRGIVSEFLPSMATVMDGLTEIFGGDSDKGIALVTEGISGLLTNLEEAIPKVMEIGGSIISAIGEAITENLPSIFEKGTEIIINLVTSIITGLPTIISSAATIMGTIVSTIINSLPQILSAGQQAIEQLGSGISENGPAAINAMGAKLSELVGKIMEKLPEFLNKGVEIIGRIATGIIDNGPLIIAAIANSLVSLLFEIASHLPEFLQKGLELLGKIAAGIIQAVPDMIAKIPGILAQLANEFKNYDWLSVGKAIIDGIANGIKHFAGSIVSAAKSAASDAFNAAKNALKINSPSKIFRDKIGKGIMEGWAMGISQGTPMVTGAVEDANDDLLDNIDDIGYDTDTQVHQIGGGMTGNSDAQLLGAVNYLTRAIVEMDEGLQDKMLTAFGSMRFQVGNREFARMVRSANARTV